jgi:DegV family protein with EDD domain
MRKVKVVTDSTADIPAELAQELEISVVPLKVHLQGQSYLDRVDIQPETFYKKLEESGELASTSQPSPIDFVETYRAIAKDGNTDLLSIHLSSAFSGTFQSALLAKSMVEEDFKVTVIDSKKASYAIGMIVVEAARAAKEGQSLDECVDLVNRMIDEMGVYFMVDTLEYLHKGGRIGKASALVGSLLNIKPILSINESGEVFALDKVRGKSKAEARIFELIREKAGNKGLKKAAVCHANRLEEAQRWAERLRTEFQAEDVVITQIGPVVGAHVGPGTIAVIVWPF